MNKSALGSLDDLPCHLTLVAQSIRILDYESSPFLYRTDCDGSTQSEFPTSLSALARGRRTSNQIVYFLSCSSDSR